MACIDKPPENAAFELEEGEIVDDFLSDISSEEEFLMRQRLKVLENYNNILGRKKQRRNSVRSGNKEDALSHDLSEISATELEDTIPLDAIETTTQKENRCKTQYKQNRRKEEFQDKYKVYPERVRERKKVHRKKKLEVKVISESSDESDDESRIKRQKLAEAVSVHKVRSDPTSLQARIQKMLSKNKPSTLKPLFIENDTGLATKHFLPNVNSFNLLHNTPEITESSNNRLNQNENKQIVDLCADDENICVIGEDTIDSAVKENTVNNKKSVDKDSDEDLESLRQMALKTKSSKAKPEPIATNFTEPESILLSDDEDAAELRLICLKSALLKKAIEMKQKQRKRKKLSQSLNSKDDLYEEELMITNDSDNNTDIESVDMDIGSDGDEKTKDCDTKTELVRNDKDFVGDDETRTLSDKQNANVTKDDELEEDEDLLRARLLTSLSKNLPNLVDPSVLESVEKDSTVKEPPPAPNPPLAQTKIKVPEEKKIVINVGDSDSEGEHEATKNLTKMHMKLSEQPDFQHKLDMFLKSARMEVEQSKLPDVVQNQEPTVTKIVPKDVAHLPEEDKKEYNKLVRRMAELERLKARQQAPALVKPQPKDTLKPRNIVNSPKFNAIVNLEEQITLSRKNIAQESATMMKLKEEETKLSQKYKIVETELKNLSTAIVFNKKQQKMVQNKLAKIRLNHQRLLNSTNPKHSKFNGQTHNIRITLTTRLQKENNPAKEQSNSYQIQKPKTNDIRNEETIVNQNRLAVTLDVCNKKKTVIMISEETNRDTDSNMSNDTNSVHRLTGNIDDTTSYVSGICQDNTNDSDVYKSPLDALGNASWVDPHGILCKFEIGGQCKDPDCKYLHPNPRNK